MKKYNHYIDGKLAATYPEPLALTRKRRTLKTIMRDDKQARTTSRLLMALTR